MSQRHRSFRVEGLEGRCLLSHLAHPHPHPAAVHAVRHVAPPPQASARSRPCPASEHSGRRPDDLDDDGIVRIHGNPDRPLRTPAAVTFYPPPIGTSSLDHRPVSRSPEPVRSTDAP